MHKEVRGQPPPVSFLASHSLLSETGSLIGLGFLQAG